MQGDTQANEDRHYNQDVLDREDEPQSVRKIEQHAFGCLDVPRNEKHEEAGPCGNGKPPGDDPVELSALQRIDQSERGLKDQEDEHGAPDPDGGGEKVEEVDDAFGHEGFSRQVFVFLCASGGFA
jgi:hypothetical protein